MRFDPEGNTAAAHAGQQQHHPQQGGYGGAAGAAGSPGGNPYSQNGAAAYGGGPTGADGFGAPPYGGPTGPYSNGAAHGAGSRAAAVPVKLKDCSTVELLQHLPTIQKLLGRLMQCVPEGASAVNPVILVSTTAQHSTAVGSAQQCSQHTAQTQSAQHSNAASAAQQCSQRSIAVDTTQHSRDWSRANQAVSKLQRSTPCHQHTFQEVKGVANISSSTQEALSSHALPSHVDSS